MIWIVRGKAFRAIALATAAINMLIAVNPAMKVTHGDEVARSTCTAVDDYVAIGCTAVTQFDTIPAHQLRACSAPRWNIQDVPHCGAPIGGTATADQRAATAAGAGFRVRCESVAAHPTLNNFRRQHLT